MAERDEISITYNILPKYAAMANLTAKVMLKGCYANSSQEQRPWRKSNPIIAKSKKCPFRTLPDPRSGPWLGPAILMFGMHI